MREIATKPSMKATPAVYAPHMYVGRPVGSGGGGGGGGLGGRAPSPLSSPQKSELGVLASTPHSLQKAAWFSASFQLLGRKAFLFTCGLRGPANGAGVSESSPCLLSSFVHINQCGGRPSLPHPPLGLFGPLSFVSQSELGFLGPSSPPAPPTPPPSPGRQSGNPRTASRRCSCSKSRDPRESR